MASGNPSKHSESAFFASSRPRNRLYGRAETPSERFIMRHTADRRSSRPVGSPAPHSQQGAAGAARVLGS